MALGWRGSYLRYREFFLNVTNLYKQRADLRAFLEIILSISTVTIFLLFALKPTALTIISLLKEIREKRATVVALDKKVSDLEIASGVYSENVNVIPDVKTAVSTFPEPDLISKQIQGLAAKNSVSVLGLSIGQTTLIGKATQKKSSEFKSLPGDASEMPLSISVKGDYSNLNSFLKDFENLRIITKIDVLAINSSQTETGQVLVAAINARVPFLGQ
jgi:hypothetical protein